MKRGRPSQLRRGFTLVEAIAAMAVLGALGSVASGVIFSSVRSYRDACVVAELHAEASSALEVVARELRQVPQSALGGADISAVTASSIAFGTSSFTLSGTDLVWVDAGGTPATLLANVSGFAVECFDENNLSLGSSLSGAACGPVRRVSVTITLTRDGRSDSIRTKVFLRGFVMGAMP